MTAAPCCMGEAARGECTCWEPVHDREQAPALPGEAIERPGGMCPDCACRPDSPERLAFEAGGPTDLRSSWPGVQALVASGQPFYCHEGMRRRIGERHPDGRFRELGPHGYAPLMGPDGVPRRADGRPAFVCAGWAAFRRKRNPPESPEG